MRACQALIPLVFALALAGCRSSESAKRTLPPQPAAPIATEASSTRAGAIPINPSNAKIAFTGATEIKSLTGSFAGFDGSLDLPTGDPKDATIRVVVDMNTTTTQIGLLTRHLKGQDFFDVARYPSAEFVSQTISPTPETGLYQVAGTMTLHGVQKPITFPAQMVVTPDEVTLEATMTIRQSDFGMIEAAKKTKDDVPVRVSMRQSRR